MKAILRRSRLSPKKANLIAGLVRGKKVDEALPFLQYIPKKGASILHDIVKSAAANAENNFGQKKEKLYIKSILVTKGPTYKRHTPISRGRVHPLNKRTSHITVELDLKDTKAKKAPAKETAKKETSKKPETAKKEDKVVEKAEKKVEKKEKDTKKT